MKCNTHTESAQIQSVQLEGFSQTEHTQCVQVQKQNIPEARLVPLWSPSRPEQLTPPLTVAEISFAGVALDRNGIVQHVFALSREAHATRGV